MTVKERKIELVEKKLKREREVKREQLRLIAAAKEDRVQRSKKPRPRRWQTSSERCRLSVTSVRRRSTERR